MEAAAAGNNALGNNYAGEGEAESLAELAKLDMTNPGMLLDKLPSYENLGTFLAITGTLVELSEAKPDEFLASPALFPALYYILDNDMFSYEDMEGEVIKILKNITKTPDHITILNAKFYREDPSNPAVNLFRGLLIKMEILPLFNMQAIMASEGEPPHVYAMEGHGCVFDKRPPIIVPRGIIWIELTLCGLQATTSDIEKLISPSVKAFFEKTPMPTDESSRQKYRADLGAITDYGFGVKFPGQPIANGTNTLFLEIFDEEGKPKNRFFKSGIERLYTRRLNDDEYRLVEGTVVRNVGNAPAYDVPYEKLFSTSIYPTLEQVIRTKPTQTNYKITFQNLFESIESQEYEVTKPMILINAACRSPCGADYGLDAPAVRRQNSEESKTKMVSELPVDMLLRVGRRNQTYLKSLIKQGLFGQAHILVERLGSELGRKALSDYLLSGRILESIRIEGVTNIYRGILVVPKEFKEFLESKIMRESDIERRFKELQLLLDTKGPDVWTLVFIEIVKLAKPQKEEFLVYEGLLDVLLRILDKKNKTMRGSIAGLMRALAATDEDKARLASQFHTIPAADGVRGESIAELRAILKDRGVIKEGGSYPRNTIRTRKHKNSIRSQHSRRRKHRQRV